MSYEWIKMEPAPRHMVEAAKLIGVKEIPGTKSHPQIIALAKDTGLDLIYKNDDTPWCGVFVAGTLKRAGREPLKGFSALRAKDWSTWGIKVTGPAEYGDILVFQREGGGHVGYYVGEDSDCYHVLGGNQSNSVNITRILKSRCIAIRRPAYNNKPSNIRTILLASKGTISTNEA